MPIHLLVALTPGRVLAGVGHGFQEAFSMWLDTMWVIVLGFALSGAVQAFVSRDEMRRRLGNHRPAAVARASLYGMASSSCSYAAAAMARSLFVGGADLLASLVFMFASTNLVIELGVVLAVLIGWQFLVAELVGGIVMIALLVVVGGLWLRGRQVAITVARARAESVAAEGADHPTHAATGDAGHGREPLRPGPGPGLGLRLRSRAGWADAAGYAISDLRMLRREILVGFCVAGFVAALVPVHFWNDLFVHGHGAWTALENAAVAPVVAAATFVCSVGNVPLAAALWKGGISLGGVVSFLFADLVTIPLLLIYRRQYGGRTALRMLALFWAVMSVAGLLTGALFDALGWVPTRNPTVVAGDSIRFDATTVLDIVAVVVFVLLYRLSRRRQRPGAGTAHLKDPVCGMLVRAVDAPAQVRLPEGRIFFCSERCKERFEGDPDRYLEEGPSLLPAQDRRSSAPGTIATDHW